MSTSSHLGRRTRLDADDRREQIVSAAQRLFARQPYELVSTGDIATAAGTTRTNIHHHFGTKRDLFLEIIERFSRQPLNLQSPDPHAAVADKVQQVLGSWLDAVEQNAEIFMTMLHASSSQDPQVSGVLTMSMRAWEGRLTTTLGMDPTNEAHRAMIRSFQAMVSVAVSEWLEGQTLTRHEVQALLCRTLIALGEVAS